MFVFHRNENENENNFHQQLEIQEIGDIRYMSIVACISGSSWMTDIPYTTGGFEMIWLRPSKKFHLYFTRRSAAKSQSSRNIRYMHLMQQHELLLFEPTTRSDPSTVVGCRYTVYGIVHRFADLDGHPCTRYTVYIQRDPAVCLARRPGHPRPPATENKNIFLRDPVTSAEKRGTHPLWPGKP